MSIEKSKEEIIKEAELLIIEVWDWLDRARSDLSRRENWRLELKEVAEKIEVKLRILYIGARIELLENELKKKTGGKT